MALKFKEDQKQRMENMIRHLIANAILYETIEYAKDHDRRKSNRPYIGLNIENARYFPSHSISGHKVFIKITCEHGNFSGTYIQRFRSHIRKPSTRELASAYKQFLITKQKREFANDEYSLFKKNRRNLKENLAREQYNKQRKKGQRKKRKLKIYGTNDLKFRRSYYRQLKSGKRILVQMKIRSQKAAKDYYEEPIQNRFRRTKKGVRPYYRIDKIRDDARRAENRYKIYKSKGIRVKGHTRTFVDSFPIIGGPVLFGPTENMVHAKLDEGFRNAVTEYAQYL